MSQPQSMCLNPVAKAAGDVFTQMSHFVSSLPVGQVPADALSNNIDGIMQAFKGFWIRGMVRQHYKKKTACYLTTP